MQKLTAIIELHLTENNPAPGKLISVEFVVGANDTATKSNFLAAVAAKKKAKRLNQYKNNEILFVGEDKRSYIQVSSLELLMDNAAQPEEI